jgi:hypothetical protein
MAARYTKITYSRPNIQTPWFWESPAGLQDTSLNAGLQGFYSSQLNNLVYFNETRSQNLLSTIFEYNFPDFDAWMTFNNLTAEEVFPIDILPAEKAYNAEHGITYVLETNEI